MVLGLSLFRPLVFVLVRTTQSFSKNYSDCTQSHSLDRPSICDPYLTVVFAIFCADTGNVVAAGQRHSIITGGSDLLEAVLLGGLTSTKRRCNVGLQRSAHFTNCKDRKESILHISHCSRMDYSNLHCEMNR